MKSVRSRCVVAAASAVLLLAGAACSGTGGDGAGEPSTPRRGGLRPAGRLRRRRQPRPYLAESLTPNSDFTEWTIALRPDVRFHDGTPLDAIALVRHLDAVAASPLFRRNVEGMIFDVEVDAAETEEGFIVLNTEAEPFDDLDVRRALAHATDRDAYVELFGYGLDRVAASPFGPDSRWHDPSVDFPPFDPERARELLAAYEAETGAPVSFTIATVANDALRTRMELAVEQWGKVGFDVTLEPKEQARHIADLVAGDFQASSLRLFGSVDPAGGAPFWHSASVEPPLPINLSRYSDAGIDATLDSADATDDFDVRKEAFSTVARQLNDGLPHIWLNHVAWGVGTRPGVHAVGDWSLPDGARGRLLIDGHVMLAQIWVT